MKTSKLFLIGALLVGNFLLVNAQPGNPENCPMNKHAQGFKAKGIPNLTEEQQTKINGLRTALQKEMLPLKNQMAELKAKQQTLNTSEKAELKAINQNIDAITQLQNQIMKKQAEHRQNVRAMLNDEQRLWFDTHFTQGPKKLGMRNCGNCQGMKHKGKHKGFGK